MREGAASIRQPRLWRLLLWLAAAAHRLMPPRSAMDSLMRAGNVEAGSAASPFAPKSGPCDGRKPSSYEYTGVVPQVGFLCTVDVESDSVGRMLSKKAHGRDTIESRASSKPPSSISKAWKSALAAAASTAVPSQSTADPKGELLILPLSPASAPAETCAKVGVSGRGASC